VGEGFPPGFESKPSLFKLGCNQPSWVTVVSLARPSRGHHILKAGSMNPEVFETEHLGFWDFGRHSNFEGNMIRGSSSE
jgi:hypothetical protein